MGSSCLFVHCLHRTTLSCPGIGQPYHLSSSPFLLATCRRQLYNLGFDGKNPPRRERGFRVDFSASLSRRYPKFRGSSPRSHCVFLSRGQLLHCNVRIVDGTRRYLRLPTRASTNEQDWQDYEDAVQHKDLEGAPEVLGVLNSFESVAVSLPAAELTPSTSTPSSVKDLNAAKSHISCPRTIDDLKILDACQMTSDLAQVGKAYDWLLSKGFLPNFGKDKASVSEGERLVTEALLMDSIGLKASKLSPKKWGLSGKSAIALPIGIVFFSYIRDSGVDVRPIAALILALGFYDAIYLGGTGLMQILSMWLPYKRRVLVHEAGHILVAAWVGLQLLMRVKFSTSCGVVPFDRSIFRLLYVAFSGCAAYLLGCPIRGVILDPVQALKMGIQGQGGTQFWDQSLEMEFSQVGLPSLTVDRYSIVLFAGIAAEALIYGEAQGGESDENMFKAVVAKLQPSWSLAKMSDQSRWAAHEAFLLLKNHKKAHAAVVRALEQESGLGSLIRAIEEAMP